MKKKSISVHLKPYSIQRKRTTTINHAFASAIAPASEYVDADLDAAIRMLGQDPNRDLICVYCGSAAETWDHLIGLVEKTQLRGYGHQIGNLVPCCRACNSSKGAKDWESYLRSKSGLEQPHLDARVEAIRSYFCRYATAIDIEKLKMEYPEKWNEYWGLRQQIIALMEKADQVATELRKVSTRR
ncbi:MAG: HNH endonuclease [Acidobacteriota bacterium]